MNLPRHHQIDPACSSTSVAAPSEPTCLHLQRRARGPGDPQHPAMPELIATAVIVLVVAALAVYAPVARSRRPAHLSTGELTSVPPPQPGNDPISRLVAVLRTRRSSRLGLTTLPIGLHVHSDGRAVGKKGVGRSRFQ